VTLAELTGLVLTFNVVTFGNGPVMVPPLQRHLVGTGALSLDQFLYAFAVGRVTPGQANLWVASLGYMMFGWPGAVVLTAAVAVPAYTMLPLVAWYHRLKAERRVAGFIRGVTSASVGLILASTIQIGRDTLTGPVEWLVFLTALALVWWRRWNAILALAAAGGLGLALRHLQLL
jgi:chromate transporter